MDKHEKKRELFATIEELLIVLDLVYTERNHLVAVLAHVFPSGIARADISGGDEEWSIHIDLPTGQISYHFHDSESYLFEGIPPYQGKWDGHDKEQVHERLRSLCEHLECSERIV